MLKLQSNSKLSAPNIPYGYNACIRGFVEELVVDDDPEYAWIDKIRRASASNEARQVAFLKLAGQVNYLELIIKMLQFD